MSHREINNLKWAVTGMLRNKYPIPSPKQMIADAVELHGDTLCLGWSGGRCSTAVLHMALQIDPNMKVVYSNTGVEFPENVQYVHDVADEWGVNLTELHADTTFWEIVKKHGMPKFRKFGDNKQVKYLSRLGVTTHRRPYCCWLLKEKARYAFYKQYEITGNVTGMRASESRARARAFNRRGIYYKLKSGPKIWVYHPIGLWSDSKLQVYLEKHNIPHNAVYDTQSRNGCWACTAYKGWEANIMRYNPRMYKVLQKKKGVMLMDDYTPDEVPCEDDL